MANPCATSFQNSRDVLPANFYDPFLSKSSKARKPSPIWDLLPLETTPGMLSMLAGMPNPVSFPFNSMTLHLRNPNSDGKSSMTELVFEDEELSACLQYSVTPGFPALREWLSRLTEEVHGRNPNEEGWKVTIGSGSQDLLHKAFYALLNPGESCFIEAPTYAGLLPLLSSLDLNLIELDCDSEGICISSFNKIIRSWDRTKPFPKLLYTIPYGSNPSGVTTSLSRRLAILRLAREHNFLIFEDDPYYFLYYGNQPRPASYFALERSQGGEIGRVVRFDSFSKIIAAGFRLGWATGPAAVLAAMELHTSTTTVQPSSLAQGISLKLLSMWGISGFLAHTDEVAKFYRQKRDMCEKSLERHLKGMAEWIRPDASMFFWIKLLLPPSQSQTNGSEGDSAHFIRTKALEHGVLLLPGEVAYPIQRQSAHARIAFSLLDEQSMDEAIARLASVLRREWENHDPVSKN